MIRLVFGSDDSGYFAFAINSDLIAHTEKSLGETSAVAAATENDNDCKDYNPSAVVVKEMA